MDASLSIYIYAILLSLGAGLAGLLGGLLAKFEHIKPNWLESEFRHGIMAFGGGALIAAVALVLVPEGLDKQPAWSGIVSFLIGAIVFMGADWFLAKRGSPLSQLMAMMLDYVPEAIVLGAVITGNFNQAVFMAAIIAAQNFPEGFNAYREMMTGRGTMIQKHVLLFLGLAACSGPFFTLLGMNVFSAESTGLGVLMTFCGGGILYLVFRDIAPQAKLDKHWLPSLGAVLGFIIGMVGEALI